MMGDLAGIALKPRLEVGDERLAWRGSMFVAGMEGRGSAQTRASTGRWTRPCIPTFLETAFSVPLSVLGVHVWACFTNP